MSGTEAGISATLNLLETRARMMQILGAGAWERND